MNGYQTPPFAADGLLVLYEEEVWAFDGVLWGREVGGLGGFDVFSFGS